MAAWTDALDNETRAYAANKGWDRLEPDAASQAMVKSYRELERMRPEPAPKEYTFADVKAPDGSAPKPEVIAQATAIATELKLPAAAATTLAQRLAADTHNAFTAAAEAETKRVTESVAALDKAWGANKEANTTVAGRAFEQLGLPKETVDALVSTLGVDKVMTMGFDLGTKMGESPMLKGSTTVDNKQEVALTRETALAERAKMFEDRVWFEKWANKEPEAVERFNRVTAAIVGDPNGQWSAPPENYGRQGDGQGTEVHPGSAKWKG